MLDSFSPTNPAILDVPSPEILLTPDGSGYPDILAANDTPDMLRDCCGAAARDFPAALWIEPKDWADAARDNDKYHTWGLNYVDRFTNQNPTHECTCHGLRTGFEACRNRQRGIIFPEGPKKGFRYPESSNGSVWVSPLSVYAEANPRKTGGAGCIQVLNIACRRGFLPEKIQPREDYGFKHQLQGTTGAGGINQSKGNWVALSQFPDGWLETAKWFMPLEVCVTTDPEQAVCALLHGRVGNYGRSGHAVPPAMFKIADKSVPYPDSYDVIRVDSWRTFQNAVRSGFYWIESVNTPDDWLKPAGGTQSDLAA